MTKRSRWPWSRPTFCANRRLEALDLIGTASAQPYKSRGAWTSLAAQLYREQAFPESAPDRAAFARPEPDRRRGNHPTRACTCDCTRSTPRTSCSIPLPVITTAMPISTLAEYHAQVGEFSEAIAIVKAGCSKTCATRRR